MERALFETFAEIHRSEMQADEDIYPCCECGKPSDCYAELDDGDFMCEACTALHTQ